MKVDEFYILNIKNTADKIDLDGDSGPRSVIIEDRKSGLVYERVLQKRKTTIWEETEDDKAMRE